MHAIKGSWVGQTFALFKSNESGGRKSSIRRSKEEIVGNPESDKQEVNDFQEIHNEVAPIEDISVPTDASIDNNVTEIVSSGVQAAGSLGNKPVSYVVVNAIQDTLPLEVEGSHEQMKAAVEVQSSFIRALCSLLVFY
ncbi:unnamed protein product [Linum tenue]|uniref:Uncharacterized protein n=1 Tax=Linum tenue TaxID=586396 RepID=A0AAV0MAJ9_9ROSI|nr:unnamed protein product [Linum tenue]